MDIPYSLALEVFGLEKVTNESDVTKAYRRLVKCVHPDKGGDEKLFCFITECKNVLLKEPNTNKSNATKNEPKQQNDNNQRSKKDVFITLSDLYDLYYSLHLLQEKYNINEIRMNTRLYIYPKFKRNLQKAITITA